MIEIILLVLIVLGFIAIITASIQDLKKREVDNWISFSLIIFALGFRFFYSLFNESFNSMNLFYQGLIGLGIFFVIGNFLYYGRVFAGGDAKLMIALGAVLPFSESFFSNIKFFSVFFLIFLFVSAGYSLAGSLILSLRNFRKFKKEFSNQMRKNKRFILPVLLLALVIMAFGFLENLFFFIGILIFVL